MSAIWGVISSKEDVNKLGNDMTQAMSEYLLDRVDHVTAPEVYFACGHQYVTNEAVNDISPIYDAKSGTYFTADIFLTNRASIIASICANTDAEEEKFSKLGDAELAQRLYLCKGDGFITEIRGCFSIAIYNSNTKVLKLYADPFAHRYLAYYSDDAVTCFGSIYRPIKACIKEKVELNEEGIAQLYIDFMPTSFKSVGTTVYKGIYHVDCACCVSIDTTANRIKTEKYYEVGKNVKPLKLNSDEEYKEAFLAQYRSSVEMLLRERDDEEVGIQLSGGLDSSSVAALAAEALAKKGRTLFGFTMVPASDYPYTNNRLYIENERFTVEAQKKRHPNLEPEFLSGDDRTPFSELEQYQQRFESPVKPILNIDNICRIYQRAKERNCRLILSGANGNASISFGSVPYYITDKLKKMQFGKAYKELKAYCSLFNISRKKYFRKYCKGLMGDLLPGKYTELPCILKKAVIERNNIEALRKSRRRRKGGEFYQSKQQRYVYGYDTFLFSHMGFYETYSSLMYGIFAVDPTTTVEMVEFAFSLPIDCQVKDGHDRRTIRAYMSDMLPECVTSEKYGRGVQAADVEFKINKIWPEIKADVIRILESDEAVRFFDEREVEKIRDKLLKEEKGIDRYTLLYVLGICSLSYFLKDF